MLLFEEIHNLFWLWTKHPLVSDADLRIFHFLHLSLNVGSSSIVLSPLTIFEHFLYSKKLKKNFEINRS